jgi:hypothetical protein
MFGLLAYGIGCLVLSFGLIWLKTLVTGTGKTAETPVAFRVLVVWLFLFFIPYGWVEYQTRSHSETVEPLVEEAVESGGIDGELLYFKVQSLRADSGRAVVVSEVADTWGGTYRNLYVLHLHKDEKGWFVEDIEKVNTKEGDAAGFTVPPYW